MNDKRDSDQARPTTPQPDGVEPRAPEAAPDIDQELATDDDGLLLLPTVVGAERESSREAVADIFFELEEPPDLPPELLMPEVSAPTVPAEPTVSDESPALPAPSGLEDLVAGLDAQLTKEPIAPSAATFGEHSDAEIGKAGQQFVLFYLGSSIYGLELAHVLETGDLPSLTPVPGVPGWLHGVVNLRGEILAVVDLGRFFGLAAEEDAGKARMLVVRDRNGAVIAGFLVDRVLGIRRLDPDRLAPPTARIDGAVTPYLRSLTAHESHVLALLDFDKLLPALEIGVGGLPA